jgi:(2Fe-2S) ferredoxin
LKQLNLGDGMAKPPAGTTALQQVANFGIAGIRRHILLCAGPDCADAKRGEAAWDYLKKRIAELRLSQAPTNVYRTKCACLRVCVSGPILVVYPDGVWYHSAEPAVIERVLQEHILGGKVVEEFVLARASLG